MTREEAIKIIQNEYKCVDRECDIERSCGKCPYMMPTKEPILKAYEMAIQALSQEPTEKPITVDEMEREYEKSKALFHKIVECDDAISRQAVFNAIEREDKWLLAAKGHNELTEMAFSGLKARIDALLPVTQKSGLEQITAEIYEHFMTIDGGVHDKSAIKCMEIIGKYKGDKE